jgi:hypothetical protein
MYFEHVCVSHKNRILKGTLYYRLMSYFLIVMLIPLLMLTLTYFSAGNRTIGRNLVEQGELAIDRAAIRLKRLSNHIVIKRM